MTTDEFIENGYIVFDQKMQAWFPTHKGFHSTIEHVEGFDDIVEACRKLNYEQN